MSKRKRYQTEAEIIADIDRLKDEIPALYTIAQEAAKEAADWMRHMNDSEHVYEGDRAQYKILKRTAKRAASRPKRQELKIKKLSEALAEFRTERMVFLSDQSVEVKS